jgi:hypothetical protein
MRFADPFKISDDLSAEEKLEAERLMFLELTQGLPVALSIIVSLLTVQEHSVPLGKCDRLVSLDQHDRRANQVYPVNRRRPPRRYRKEHPREPPQRSLGNCESSSR